MRNYCTLFDINYCNRGLALIESLERVTQDFKLFVLALDEKTEIHLISLQKSFLKVISLTQVETYFSELNVLKTERTRAEYCWTLTPFVITYCIEKYTLQECTYLDADLLFYNNPEIIFSEAEKNNYSVIITEHNYTPKYDQTETSGKYCVQFMTFKNNEKGLTVLAWWKDRCTQWCFSRVEDGKFGDQKYLDDWTTRFVDVYVPSSIGVGAAPWNIQKYTIIEEQNMLFIQDKITRQKSPLIFYHFHRINDYAENIYLLNSYDLSESIKQIIYIPYLKKINQFDILLQIQREKYRIENQVKYDKKYIRGILRECKHLFLAFIPKKITTQKEPENLLRLP